MEFPIDPFQGDQTRFTTDLLFSFSSKSDAIAVIRVFTVYSVNFVLFSPPKMYNRYKFEKECELLLLLKDSNCT